MAWIQYETRTHHGTCAQHGQVTGVKQVPKLKFPVVITAVARGAAALSSYKCPQCGGRVS
jgi:hypothetical protein